MARVAPPTERCAWSWTAGIAATVAAGVIMVGLALFSDNSWLERSTKRAEINKARDEVARLLHQRQEYQERLTDLTDGDLEMERLARERLDLVRPGERIYRFAD